MPEDIFDMSNVRTFKENEKKKWGMIIRCSVFGHRSADLSKAFGSRNLCYYTIIDFNEVDIRIYLPEKVIIHRGLRPR